MIPSATGLLEPVDAASVSAWYRKAGVRGAPRRMSEEDEIEQAKTFFPEHLVPHLNHEALAGLAPPLRRYLNAQHLFQWLDFTTHFEVAVVNRSCQRIAEGGVGLEVSDATRMAAFQIYIDEGYHSLYNLDVRRQLETTSGIVALPFDFQPFLAQLDAVVDRIPELRVLLQLLQVVVFETLITSLLVEIPNDRSVMNLVRDTVRDHAVDEGRHHKYFANLFTQLWQQLPMATRVRIAPFLPELIVRSLTPNTTSPRLALHQVGLPPTLIADIIADSYSAQATRDYVRNAAGRTISLFKRCGVLEVAGAEEAFHRFGLL
jgi:P-aminobenzoate N-oxygenase AurF